MQVVGEHILNVSRRKCVGEAADGCIQFEVRDEDGHETACGCWLESSNEDRWLTGSDANAASELPTGSSEQR